MRFGEDKMALDAYPHAYPDIIRFKGLGEMQPEELKRTPLDPNSWRLLRVHTVDVAKAGRILVNITRKHVEARFNFVMAPAAQADLDL
jgi:DNA gyrase subunit B/topoisomerase-4 subunit B